MIIIDNDIKCTKDDLLDFKKLYESISNHLSYYEEKDTLIISIEGEWGSGKTSLSNFIIEKIEEIEEKNIVSNEILHKKIFVIKFSPWMITDLNNLIKYFFSELMKTILKINKKLKKQQVIDDFKKFVQLITPDKFTIGGAEYSIDKFFNSEESIFKSKVKIANYLKDLESKILIVVDDIDRLTDSETEIFFRLIKGIADFDNLIYLLLFDKVIVSNSLKTFKNEDGEKYLDKIIQYSISIPKTSSNILKNQLISKISEIYKPEENNIKFLKFFSIFNKYIKNLRDVKRLSNSLNIEYPLVQDNVNFIDFMIITLIKNQNNKLYNFIKNNKYLFLINHSKEDTENYKKKVLNVLNNEDFNKYLDLIEIIFPILNNINVSYDTKNKYISSLESFDYYFSISYQYEHFDNEIINAIDNILYNYGNFASSLKFLISKKKAIDFIDNFSLIINNNKDYFIINDYSTIILNLLSGYNSFNFTDNIENVILKEKIMFNMKILIKKLNLKQLTRLFSEHTIDTKRAILINHILEEETFEKIPRNKVLEINNKFKSIVEKDVVNYEFCSFDDDIITFKGNNNYEIIYNLTKQKINPKKLKQTLKNYNNYSKESFFNIIREFKTYIIKNDIYNIIIDKELLFQFVDEASINEYYNSIKISDLSIEEESLYKLY